jgi:GntR family transcriptional regulator/MocR family aminotransferase
MLSLTPILNENLSAPLYQQLFIYIKEAIISKDISTGDKLPSLRNLAKSLKISVTTVELAYDQLQVEGYITSKPGSGYLVNDIFSGWEHRPTDILFPQGDDRLSTAFFQNLPHGDIYTDTSCFDFMKWKKCTNTILNDYSPLLLTEGDIQGEPPLRDEISRYIYQSRGVRCSLHHVVIAAGTQQLVNILCIILKRMGIDHVSFEDPGYQPVRSIFRDRSFKMTYVPIDKEGIRIERLPANIPSAVYVSPSNQFPTGSVMTAVRRYSLLDWAFTNRSIIIEDDYNSELRYDSRPVPSLQGLDTMDQVVYLGSFSSTLFPSLKISYMVLPSTLLKLFKESLSDYVQTSSKAEQLTLALYMNGGFYQTNLRRQKKLYAQKIQLATETIVIKGKGLVEILNNSSGIHMLLKLRNKGKTTEEICQLARSQGLTLTAVPDFEIDKNYSVVMLFYTRIPMDKIGKAIEDLISIL